MSNMPKQLRQTLLRTLWLGAGLLLSNAASAITVSSSPTVCASVASIGTVAWSNPTRALSSNNSYATASVDGTTTRFLRCTGYTFAIPAGATINGITVSVERRSNSTANGGSRDAAVRVVKAGVIGTADRSTTTTYTTADVIEAHGGAADLWGEAWTAEDINAASFGAAFAATKASAAGAAHTVRVDHVRITVDYSFLPGTYSVTASPTTCASIVWTGGTRAWSNPTRAISSNNSYATASVDGTTTRFLRCTGYNFAVPVGAIINGITVNVERKSDRTSNGGSRDAAMRVVKAGVIGTTDRSTATTYTTTDVIQAHGGAADLWGAIWTPADINAANFGAAFAATKASSSGPAHIVSVDHMPITVTFTITGLDHYELSLQTSSITCLPSTATVTACADNSSPCTNRYLAASGSTATLAASAGTLAATTVTFGATGVASTTLSYPSASDGATASVTLSGEQTAATNPRKCCPDGINCAVANSCSTTFNTAGFIFSASAGGIEISMPTQIAGTSSNTYYLRAVKPNTNPAVMACESALAGPQSINLAYECNNPTSCSATNLMNVGGTTIARNNNGSVASYTPVSMTFDANGNAPFTFTYFDVGQVKFYANKTVNSAPLTGTSTSFVVRPDRFVVSNIIRTSDSFANPAAANATGTAFIQAGAPFTATITATASNGATTPNYGKEIVRDGVLLTPTLVAPSGGAIPAITNGTIAGSSFTNGVATVSNLAWDEVGVITLTPSIADGNYLGVGNVTGATSNNIGRFIPHHFALLTDAAIPTPLLTNRSDLTCAAATFTYMGEPFSLGFTLTAQNAANNTTLNYDTINGFAKLDGAADPWTTFGANRSLGLWGIGALTAYPACNAVFATASPYNTTYSSVAPACPSSPASPIAQSPAASRISVQSNPAPTGTWINGAAIFSASTIVGRAGVADGPYLVSLGISPQDEDGVTLLPSAKNLDADNSGASERALLTSTEMRFGRLRMNNAYGSELLPLPVPLLAQYWNGTGFILNTDDSCTQVPVPVPVAITTPLSPGLTFYAPPTTATNALQAGQTTATLNTPFISGNGGLRLSTPGLGNYGYVDVLITTPDYLQYNWNGTATAGNFFDDNPGARATFGKYKQRNELIYMREIH